MVHCAAAATATDAAARQAPEGRPAPGGAGGGREPEGLPCPRCDSVNTKFCYYNNYNLSQPRHFCRACRRYWTRGGALRNVPVGGGTRKATPAGRRKRAAAPAPAPASPSSYTPPPSPLMVRPPYGVGLGLPFAAPSPLAAVDPDRRLLDLGGSFTSLIAPDVVGGHFSAAAAFLLGGYAPAVGSAAAALPPPPPPPPPPSQQQPSQQQQPQPVSQALPEALMWSMGWPDLSI
ncbi:hypothetical protein U9M48_021079 [Paspalum notatum var. saurae]|uniref:Dof zinc finger protein n=1 Tax=Paspalum notatum var. saurae TaxID=547442 RepID=A0AAQ3WSM4_PASNO